MKREPYLRLKTDLNLSGPEDEPHKQEIHRYDYAEHRNRGIFFRHPDMKEQGKQQNVKPVVHRMAQRKAYPLADRGFGTERKDTRKIEIAQKTDAVTDGIGQP